MCDLKDWAPAVSWVLVLWGWHRVTKENNKRELRKEVKDRIDTVAKLLDSVEDDAIEYYRMDNSDESIRLARKIKVNVASVGHHLNILTNIDDKYRCSHELIALRKAVTGSDFDSAERAVRELGDQIFTDIAAASVNVIRKLDRAYAGK
ncbi:hypothetical protein [Chromobacterium haemolyticum]|uniref:hypothetical protein n=1 Tax=Chromobacterium haemolyticum TaxID=394935 RepID=UPI001177A0A8|nr:hypothetical protein [Chromobacterium haemolyticum]